MRLISTVVCSSHSQSRLASRGMPRVVRRLLKLCLSSGRNVSQSRLIPGEEDVKLYSW